MSERLDRFGRPQMVDITLRLDPRNLANLVAERNPVTWIQLSDNGDGTYALNAQTPVSYEAARRLPNHNPAGSKLDGLTDEQLSELGEAFDPDIWDEAVQRAASAIRAERSTNG